MRNRCIFSLGLVLTISLTSIIAFAFSFTDVPAKGDVGKVMAQTGTDTETELIPTTTPVVTAEYVQETESEAETETKVEEQSHIASMDWSEDEVYQLAKIAMAEAESEDTEGKALVILVVLNRVQSDEFPDTIEEVILEDGQFAPVGNGRYDEVEPNEDCYKAIELVEAGWDGSCGATYFESKSNSTWHSENLTFLFRHGKHYFYKE